MRGYPRGSEIPFDWDGEINYDSPQAAGLVAWWPMLGNAGASVVRDYARGNKGTFAAGMAWTVNPILGPVPRFSGSGIGADNDYILLSNSVALGTTHTVACWVVLNNTAAAITGMLLSGAANYYVGYLNGTTLNYSAGVAVSFSVSYTRGTLAHFAFVRDGTAVTFYKNGIKQGDTQTLGANNALTLVNVSGHNDHTYCINGQLGGLVMSSITLPSSVIWQMAQPDGMWDLYMVRRRWWAVKVIPPFLPLGQRRENTLLRM